MAKRKPNPAGWTAIKKTLANWPHTGLVNLLKELHDLSPDNRAFFAARLLPAESAGKAVAAVEKRLNGMITPTAIYNGHFAHSETKRVVDQFEKATGDPALVAQVLISDLAASCGTFEAIGDEDTIVRHILSVTNRLHKTLQKSPPAKLRPLAESLTELANDYGRSFGYGISDELVGMAEYWTARAAEAGTIGDSNDEPARPEPDF